MKKKMTAAITVSVLVTGISFSSAQAAPVVEVQRGDTLWGIANTYDTSVDRLFQLNDLNSTLIVPNQTLNVQDSEEDSEEHSEEHVVEEGDTLWQIGADNNVSVEQLKEWNDLSSDLILIGQRLLIQEPGDVGSSEEASEQAEEEETQQQETEQAEQDEQEQQEAEQTEQENQEPQEDEQAEQEEQQQQVAEQDEQGEQQQQEAEQDEQEEQQQQEAEQTEQEEQQQ
ncbi:LysM peptidoglycan-binding domain-containing protein, partial [Natribacillus halophilus]